MLLVVTTQQSWKRSDDRLSELMNIWLSSFVLIGLRSGFTFYIMNGACDYQEVSHLSSLFERLLRMVKWYGEAVVKQRHWNQWISTIWLASWLKSMVFIIQCVPLLFKQALLNRLGKSNDFKGLKCRTDVFPGSKLVIFFVWSTLVALLPDAIKIMPKRATRFMQASNVYSALERLTMKLSIATWKMQDESRQTQNLKTEVSSTFVLITMWWCVLQTHA